MATGNVHAHARERAPLQDAFTALRHHTTLDASEPMRRGNFSHVLASPEAMAARFPEHPEAVAETRELAARLRFDLSADLGYRYPGSDDEQALSKLAELCWARLGERYPAGHPHAAAAHARLEEELRVIDSLGLAGFFLLHRDLLELAREVAVEVRGPSSVRALLPPGRGRGSSVSSIVCYLTGLSHIDPVSNELFLGRFLNEELTALPDIDLDFPRDIRAVLIPRVHERYGRERSALVAAFPTFRSRGAIRELGKVLGLPPGELERVARGAEPWAVRGAAADVENGARDGAGRPAGAVRGHGQPGAVRDVDRRVAGDGQRPRSGRHRLRRAALAHLRGALQRAPRPLGVAGAAVRPGVRAPAPPVPALGRDDRLHPPADRLLPGAAGGHGGPPALPVGQGLVRRRGLPEDRPAGPGDAVGGRALRGDDRARARRAGRPLAHPVRRRARPTTRSRRPTRWASSRSSRARRCSRCTARGRESLDDLTIQVAIVRPGPILGGAVNPYISRLQQLREDPDYEVPYDHPSLEPVLHDTLGTIIFQDQVIEVAMAFAGFSPGEAEGLRRAMSRKRSAAAIEAYHQRFLDGAAATHGVDAETAERVYTMIVGFSGFGFPKAHGAAFGLLAYQSTWLRVHYGPEFLCALLNEQPMGFYAPDTLVHEAQRRGIELAPADVNASEVECTVEEVGPPARVRIGLGYVLGVRTDEVEALVEARRERGPFRSLADLASRAGAGRPALEKLAWAGACDALALAVANGSPAAGGHARRTALWQLGVAAPGRARSPRERSSSLPLEVPAAPALRALDPWEGMVADYATTGLTLGPHPLALLRPNLPAGTVTCQRPRAPPARDAGADRRPGRGAPAAGDRQGDRLHPARGRVRHDQPDRAAAGLRAPPADRAHRAADHGRGAARAAAAGGRRDQRLRPPPARAGHARGRRRRRRRAGRAPRRRRGRRRGRRGAGRATAQSAAAVAGAADFRGVAPAVQSFAAGAGGEAGPAAFAVGTVRFRPRMTTLIFVLVWVLLGLGLVFIALSGGPSGAAAQ